MKDVMVNEVKRLASEENGSNSRPVQESTQETFVLAYVNGKLLKAAIDQNGQIKEWLDVAPLNKSLVSRCLSCKAR